MFRLHRNRSRTRRLLIALSRVKSLETVSRQRITRPVALGHGLLLFDSGDVLPHQRTSNNVAIFVGLFDLDELLENKIITALNDTNLHDELLVG